MMNFQVISFLDSLIAAKAKPSSPSSGLSKEVGSVAGVVNQDRIVPKVAPPTDHANAAGAASGGVVVNGIKRLAPSAGSGSAAAGSSPSVVVINSHHHGNRGTHNGATASKVQAAVTPQNSTSGSVKAKFVDGEFSQSCK